MLALVAAGQAVTVAFPSARLTVLGLTVLLLDLTAVWFLARLARRSRAERQAVLFAGAGRAAAVVANLALSAGSVTGEQGWWWAGAVARLTMFAALTASLLITPLQRLAGRRRLAL